jgi:cytochrome c oxidase cbb3-type subunit III
VILHMPVSSGRFSTARHGKVAPSVLLVILILLMVWPGFAKAQPAEEGRAIYERHCSVCHGDQGGGAYWASSSLNPPPRDFTRTDSQALSRETMIDAVAHGRNGTAMTAWDSRLSSGQIAAVIDFIRAEFLPRQREVAGNGASGAAFPGGLMGDAAKGGVFFHANCAECHGHAGDGRGRRADLMIYKPLDFTTPKTRSAFDRTRLFDSISRGVPGTTMPAWSKVLSSQQIADVAEYVVRTFIEGERAAQDSVALRDEVTDAGRRTYLQNCSYCHGTKGDGRTAAAQVLDPKPRDFTGQPRLSSAEVAAAVREGRGGTAMPSFAKVLSKTELNAVAEYVAQVLAGSKGEKGRYHTDKNGWPAHDARYGPAIPFALGELAVDVPPSTLSQTQREGLELFKGACVSCHFGRRDRPVATSIRDNSHKAADYEKGPHDKEPEMSDLTPAEAEGRRLYQSACAQCHAADGTSKNWIGRFLNPSPTDFSTPQFRELLSSDAFVNRTLRAPEGTSMPSFENILSREQAEAIATYVRRAFRAP